MSKNVLIVSGHPDLHQSLANRTNLDKVATQLSQAQIRYLDQLYPNYQIDVPAEQTAFFNKKKKDHNKIMVLYD